jgi:hypothetical protein
LTTESTDKAASLVTTPRSLFPHSVCHFGNISTPSLSGDPLYHHELSTRTRCPIPILSALARARPGRRGSLHLAKDCLAGQAHHESPGLDGRGALRILSRAAESTRYLHLRHTCPKQRAVLTSTRTEYQPWPKDHAASAVPWGCNPVSPD